MLLLAAALSVLSISPLQTPASATPIDVAHVKVGPPAVVAELDLGKLKGELRQLAWSPDGTQLYVQTAEGRAPNEKLRHYIVAVAGGAPSVQDVPPAWAAEYWLFKAGRSAPGLDNLVIEAKKTFETIKSGTGQAGALDREADPVGGNINNIDTMAKGNDQNQKATVWRLTLLDQTVSEFVNTTPRAGVMFGWGPEGSGAIAFTDVDGRLFLFDQRKHKQSVAGVKEAVLPAWTMDGSRLAWAQKSGRRKYTLVYAPVTR